MELVVEHPEPGIVELPWICGLGSGFWVLSRNFRMKAGGLRISICKEPSYLLTCQLNVCIGGCLLSYPGKKLNENSTIGSLAQTLVLFVAFGSMLASDLTPASKRNHQFTRANGGSSKPPGPCFLDHPRRQP